MSELGRLLAEARTAKGLSPADVESVTRIRQNWLEALENGEYNKLPRGAVARGFLRTYAAYLGLDTQAALDLYTSESGDAGDDVAIAEPGKPRVVDYRPLEVELIDERSDNGWVRWLIALVLVAALAGSAWWFLSRNPGWNPFAAAPPPAPTATSTPTSTPWVVTATPRATITLPVAEAQATSDILPLPTPTVPASPTLTPRPTATPEFTAGVSLDLQAVQRSWIRVTVDGEVAEEGFLDAGVTRLWEANESITLRTGNAGGVTLVLNGQDLGPMGAVGEVVERSWALADTGEVLEASSATPEPATPTPTPAG